MTHDSAAARTIELFGGASRLARLLNLPVSTVGSWKAAGSTPASHQSSVLATAAAHNIPLTAGDLIPATHVPAPRQKISGPEIHPMPVAPIPPAQPLVSKGLYLQELLRLS